MKDPDKIMIRKFQPMTAGRNAGSRKKTLSRKIRTRFKSELDTVKRRYDPSEEIGLDVCFYLWDKDQQQSRVKKDLDNLLKIVLDILPEFYKCKGIGVLCGNKDHLVSEIHAKRESVRYKKDEGLDIGFFSPGRA